jgi:agmatinase
MADDKIDYAIDADHLYGIQDEPSYSGVLSFMRRRYTKKLDGVDMAISGVPLDLMGSHRPGARFGPSAIRKASAHLAWTIPWPWTFDPFEHLAVVDFGDCFIDIGRPETIEANIYKHAQKILNQNVAMLTFGGDHYVTYPLIKAHAEKFGPLSLIHFDAHPDTWDDNGRITHGTMFHKAAKEKLIDPKKSIQVGIRVHQSDAYGFNVIHAPEAMHNPIDRAIDKIQNVVADNPVYLSFDIDCLDPAYAPGTGTPVPGGLSTLTVLEIIRGLSGINFVGMDLVEVCPAYDVSDITALAAATIAAELICIFASNKRK